MLAGMSLGTDLKRFSRGTMPRIALVTVILLPLLYGAMYLWAFWNPFAAIDKIADRDPLAAEEAFAKMSPEEQERYLEFGI